MLLQFAEDLKDHELCMQVSDNRPVIQWHCVCAMKRPTTPSPKELHGGGGGGGL